MCVCVRVRVRVRVRVCVRARCYLTSLCLMSHNATSHLKLTQHSLLTKSFGSELVQIFPRPWLSYLVTHTAAGGVGRHTDVGASSTVSAEANAAPLAHVCLQRRQTVCKRCRVGWGGTGYGRAGRQAGMCQ